MSFDLAIVDGNIPLGSNGDLQKIVDAPKLQQDIIKIVLTPRGSKKTAPFYGSLVNNSVIGNVFDETFIASYASSQLRDALNTIQKMQQEQEKRQYLSPQESLGAIKKAEVQQSEKDPRFWSVDITVITKALQTAGVEFDLDTTVL